MRSRIYALPINGDKLYHSNDLPKAVKNEYIYIYIIIIFYSLNHTYNNIGYKWTPQKVIDLYML